MAQTLIEKIYDDYCDAVEADNSDETIIAYFKKNFVLYDNISSFEDDYDLDLFIKLTLLHTHALLAKGYYNDTIDRSIKALVLIDSEFEKKTELDIQQVYWDIIFIQGQAYYRLKDYKESTKLFRYLMKSHPNNDLYKTWLNSCLFHERQWVGQAMYIIAIVLLICEIGLKAYIPIKIRIFMDITGLSMILFYVIYNQYAERSLRISKKT